MRRKGQRPPADSGPRSRSGAAIPPIRRIRTSARTIETPKTKADPAPTNTRTFRVLVAVHRPRYRARTERAMIGFDWEVRSLLNKEDPVGLVHQRQPNVLIISDDFGRQKDLG